MNEAAVALNRTLEGSIAEVFLSDFGKRIYFPNGIIAQSAEAKAKASAGMPYAANATIGMAFEHGKPFFLSCLKDAMPSLSAEETVAYAPTSGVQKLRESWQKKLTRKNPFLEMRDISVPVVVPGITAGLSYTADLFVGAGDVVIASDPCWDNYGLIFEERRGAAVRSVPLFGEDLSKAAGLDLAALKAAIDDEAKKGIVRLVLNFPNNPTGYTPTRREARDLCDFLRAKAEAGAKILVICDDAYYGLFYEEEIYPQSLFSPLASMHKNILAVKLDGPIKEEYVWGFRTAFVTFGNPALNDAQTAALLTKLAGTIRSSVSCSNTPSQYLALKVNDDNRTAAEKEKYGEILYNRYKILKTFVTEHPQHPVLTPYPFNSGYFMCFRTACDAEALRRKLLDEYGIGLVSLGPRCLRVAFSSLDEDKIETVCQKIYEVAEDFQ